MHRAAIFLLLFHDECVTEGPFDPPSEFDHSDLEDGIRHGRGKETPFLCRDAGGDLGPCPTDVRPALEDLSCDAAGCHGSYAFDAPIDADRALHGSDGPSCYTCHGQEWSGRVQ